MRMAMWNRFNNLALFVICSSLAAACQTGDPSAVKTTNSFPTNSGPDIVKVDILSTAGIPDTCTGTIVGKNTILTAAHCLEGPGFLGASFAGVNPVWQALHPNYVHQLEGTGKYDIGIMVFAQDIASMVGVATFRKVSLGSPKVGEEVWLVGYGLIDIDVSWSNGNKMATCNTIDSAVPGTFVIVGYKDAAVSPTPPIPNCVDWTVTPGAGEKGASAPGDSGGPVMSPDGAWILGLVSGGLPSANPAFLRVAYTSFDQAETYNFLYNAEMSCGHTICADFTADYRQ